MCFSQSKSDWRRGKIMKKMNVLVKGTLAVAIGLSSLFLAEKTEVLPSTTVLAASEEDADLSAARNSLEAKKIILEEKLNFAKKFMETRAYKDAKKANKEEFNKEVGQIKDALLNVNDVLARATSVEEFENAEEEVDPALGTFNDVLNNIYREDPLISEAVKGYLAIQSNKVEYIPPRYLPEYKRASKALEREYENIWLDNKVYKEKELKGIIDRYQAVVKSINDYNRGNDYTVKIKKTLAKTKKKVEAIQFIKDKTPATAKRYEKVINEALENAQKVIERAEAWLKANDK